MSRVILVLVLAVMGLSGCGGGASTESTPGNNLQNTNYYGNINGDLHRGYAIAVWPNLSPANRCGGACHVVNGSGRGAFVDNDIEVAFNAAVPALINTTNPSQSILVERMRAGHNCWHGNSGTDRDLCASDMIGYINDMLGITPTTGGGEEISLSPPPNPNKIPGDTRTLPATATSGSPSFETAVYNPVMRPQCMECHRENADQGTPPQSPFFASDDVNSAYEAAKTKMNLDDPASSRVVQRLMQGHNCFNPNNNVDTSCQDSAAVMQAAIASFAAGINVAPPNLGSGASSAMNLLTDGLPASGGNRVEADAIAIWEFKEGPGNNVTTDRISGIDLTLLGTEGADYNWVGGYGIQFNNSLAQSDTSSTTPLFDNIAGPAGSNEYSIEAWVIPENVADNNAMIVTYGANRNTLNFGMGQSMYNYDFLQADSTAVTEFSTPDAAEALQTTLQHVVLTYDSQNGRQIFVNGQLIDAPEGNGENISGWNNQQFMILGGGQTPWKGIIRMVAIHDRALQQQQILQNYEAGVGEKSFVMFNVSNIIGNECMNNGNPMCFIYFEVSEFDSYSYLFYKPTFISFDPAYTPSNIPLRGMRIGINGRIADTGQAFANLNMNIDGSVYTPEAGQVLSIVGSIIPQEQGAAIDEFFLSFETLGSNGSAFTEPVASNPVLTDPAPVTEIGVRMFDEINQTMAQLSGIDPNLPSIGGTQVNDGADGVFTTYRQQFPASAYAEGFLSAHQMAIAQLAMTYCDELFEDTAKRDAYFNGFNFNQTAAALDLPAPAIPTDLANGGNAAVLTVRDQFINPLIEKMMNIDLVNSGNNLAVQPAENDIRIELNDFVTRMRACGGSCNTTARTREIVTGTCAIALGNATMLVQ